MKVETIPKAINGASTCLAPKIIKSIKLATKMKKLNLVPGLNCIPLVLDKSTYGINNNANKADNIAITPNNLFGIERSIA